MKIRYMKIHYDVSSLAINLLVFSLVSITMLPILAYLYLTGAPSISTLMLVPVLSVIGAGMMKGVGQILNYETFRRIDGFIAFLMFNISILITFCAEVFFLGKFSPTWVLILGGSVIISSTILAEIINSHCQKKGL